MNRIIPVILVIVVLVTGSLVNAYSLNTSGKLRLDSKKNFLVSRAEYKPGNTSDNTIFETYKGTIASSDGIRMDAYNGFTITPYYFHTNAIGSTTAVTDANGQVVERYKYSLYGMPTFMDAAGNVIPKSTIGNNILFQGREYEPKTNFYYFRARHLDPIMGRFLQTDPMGYQDSMNLYQAFNQNPVNFVDPMGLQLSNSEMEFFDIQNQISSLEQAILAAIDNPRTKPEQIDNLITAYKAMAIQYRKNPKLVFALSDNLEVKKDFLLQTDKAHAAHFFYTIIREIAIYGAFAIGGEILEGILIARAARLAAASRVSGASRAAASSSSVLDDVARTVTYSDDIARAGTVSDDIVRANSTVAKTEMKALPPGKTRPSLQSVSNQSTESFVSGVKVKDIRTGKVYEGTVNLKPSLDRIAAGQRFPHRNDGAIFQNRPFPGKATPELPVKPQGYYNEYVHPTPGISGPGPQRIVIGKGGEIYYTPDHYKTFIQIK